MKPAKLDERVEHKRQMNNSQKKVDGKMSYAVRQFYYFGFRQKFNPYSRYFVNREA